MAKDESVEIIKFQPTRPRGARPRMLLLKNFTASFNPRAHEGRDGSGADLLPWRKKFQPTRPRGARLINRSKHIPDFVFQPTRPRGARL